MAKSKNSSIEWLVAIISAVLIAIVVRGFLYATYEVQGSSMYPTLNGEELLIVNQWIYKVDEPEYGDIVVFHTYEGNKKKDFIKRVIGLPGDRIRIKKGAVYRNGNMLEEPYISEAISGDVTTITVPEGMVYVLGDNRNNSKDSRQIGPVQMEDVVGRAEVVLWPFDQIKLLSSDE